MTQTAPAAPLSPYDTPATLRYDSPLDAIRASHVLVPHAIVLDERLDVGSLRVYLRLVHHAVKREFPGTRVLATELRLEESAVATALRHLEASGLLSRAGASYVLVPVGQVYGLAPMAPKLAKAKAEKVAPAPPSEALKLALAWRDLRQDGTWPSRRVTEMAMAQAKQVLALPQMTLAEALEIQRWLHGHEFWGAKHWTPSKIAELRADWRREGAEAARLEARSQKPAMQLLNAVTQDEF